MTNLAFRAQDTSVPADRWIATLSDGRTVFQNELPGKKTAWVRLKEYLSSHNLQVTSLRLEACGNHITLPRSSNVDGFWHAKRVSRLFAITPAEDHFIGVGYIINNCIHVTWVNTDNGQIKCEVKDRDEVDDRSIISVDHNPAG